MKKETTANKLLALLGLQDKVEVPTHFQDKNNSNKKNNRPIAVNLDEIMEFRYVQGLIYYLQAPELFTPRICRHCGEGFLVSRKNISLCSLTCLEKSFEEMGLTWTKKAHYSEINDDPYEPMVNDQHIWDGNEPLYIRNLPKLKRALEVLIQYERALELPSGTGGSTPVLQGSGNSSDNN